MTELARDQEDRSRDPVRTTIVGGQPTVRTKSSLPIPEGIEKLIQRAAADSRFRSLMYADREEAARSARIKLTETEKAVLLSIPDAQLTAIIENTEVPAQSARRSFLRAALGGVGAWLAGLLGAGATTGGCRRREGPPVEGIRPDIPPPREDEEESDTQTEEEAETPDEGETPEGDDDPAPPVTRGIQPDIPVERASPAGIRPDEPPPGRATKGIRPDVPPPKGE